MFIHRSRRYQCAPPESSNFPGIAKRQDTRQFPCFLRHLGPPGESREQCAGGISPDSSCRSDVLSKVLKRTTSFRVAVNRKRMEKVQREILAVERAGEERAAQRERKIYGLGRAPPLKSGLENREIVEITSYRKSHEDSISGDRKERPGRDRELPGGRKCEFNWNLLYLTCFVCLGLLTSRR